MGLQLWELFQKLNYDLRNIQPGDTLTDCLQNIHLQLTENNYIIHNLNM